jgi:hypothetical protein
MIGRAIFPAVDATDRECYGRRTAVKPKCR